MGTTLNTLGDSTLPGVYAYDGPLSTVVNGSLWSLRYEALSYVLLLFLWTMFRTSGRVAVAITAMALLTWISPLFESAMVGVAYTLPYFAAGVSMHWVHRRYGTNRAAAIVSVALFAVSAVFGMAPYAFPVCGAYAIVFAADRPNVGSRIAAKVGDCSYGLYLYGWPAEQMMKELTSTNNPWLLFVMSVPLAFAFALISCHLVERPAMRASGFCIARLRSGLGRVCEPRRPEVVGAKVAFVVGAALLLSSRTRWWYFLESMGELLLTVGAGALVATLLTPAIRSFGSGRSPSARAKRAAVVSSRTRWSQRATVSDHCRRSCDPQCRPPDSQAGCRRRTFLVRVTAVPTARGKRSHMKVQPHLCPGARLDFNALTTGGALIHKTHIHQGRD